MSGAIWLASYPRSGNTWARFLLMAAVEGHADLARLSGYGRPVLARGEIDRQLECDSEYMTAEELGRARADLHAALYVGAAPPVLVKVHDRWQLLPDGRSMHDPSWTHAAIYLVRDPRDVAISWAAFRQVPIDRAIDFLADRHAHLGVAGGAIGTAVPQPLGDWSAHAASWLYDSPHAPLVLRYEDITADPHAALAAMLDRIGALVPAGRIAAAVAAGRFDRLAGMERRTGFAETPTGAGHFFRNGQTAAWRDVLTVGQRAAIEQRHGGMMRRLGYL